MINNIIPNPLVPQSLGLHFSLSQVRIAVIGLGYVGLPLARLFATKYPVVGYDINQARVNELMNGHDSTLEVEDNILQSVLITSNPIPQNSNPAPCTGLFCTADMQDIADANFYIVTVPTPVDRNNNPDLTPLYKASEIVGKVISTGDIVVYESTVYPGVTEDECVPIVEKVSGLKFNRDFFAGYSPERINPGDKEHTVEKIMKVTSGSTPEIGKIVNEVYASVIIAGTHLAPTIKVAEAAKVIENAQRDINIAFVNELSKIFNKMGIDTQDVLKAAGTKWNFLPFKPGLVGGHCIGVDPYYLAQAAQRYGYNPEIILAGRRMNDSMGNYVAEQVIKLMLKKGIQVVGSNVLVLGFTFKENCPDVRNTKVIDIVKTLQDYNAHVTIHDPWAKPEIAMHEYGVKIINSLPSAKFDAVILAVAHKEFEGLDISTVINKKNVLYDVKGMLKQGVDGRL
ncbi:MAG: UDP-N-acetyl-D-glucosamine 6-dehydrogenase [Bacteroidetes bacterium ADurb.BinA174]|nr:MAG: UDP-N-acetyl-D-glucosamine 6-dehydrogenase [Bacteroidetes bacterium ADurb.BinA174]